MTKVRFHNSDSERHSHPHKQSQECPMSVVTRMSCIATQGGGRFTHEPCPLESWLSRWMLAVLTYLYYRHVLKISWHTSCGKLAPQEYRTQPPILKLHYVKDVMHTNIIEIPATLSKGYSRNTQ